MLSDIGAGEIIVLALVALFVFGPDRLPSMARQAGKTLRDLRGMVSGIRKDLSDELGVDELDLKLPQVNPRSYVRKHVLEGIDLDLGLDGGDTGRTKGAARAKDGPAAKVPSAPAPTPVTGTAGATSEQPAAGGADSTPTPRPAYDTDAT